MSLEPLVQPCLSSLMLGVRSMPWAFLTSLLQSMPLPKGKIIFLPLVLLVRSINDIRGRLMVSSTTL